MSECCESSFHPAAACYTDPVSGVARPVWQHIGYGNERPAGVPALTERDGVTPISTAGWTAADWANVTPGACPVVTCETIPAHLPVDPTVVDVNTLSTDGKGDWEAIGQLAAQIPDPTTGQTWGPPSQVLNNLNGPITGNTAYAAWVPNIVTGPSWGYFRKEFTTTQAYTMNWAVFADNFTRRVWIDGVVVYTGTQTTSPFSSVWTAPQTSALPAGLHEIIIEVAESGANTRGSFDAELVPAGAVDVAALLAAGMLPPCNGYVVVCSDGTSETLNGDPIVEGVDWWRCAPDATVVAVIEGCTENPAYDPADPASGPETLPAHWYIKSDGSTDGPFLDSALPGNDGGCC